MTKEEKRRRLQSLDSQIVRSTLQVDLLREIQKEEERAKKCHKEKNWDELNRSVHRADYLKKAYRSRYGISLKMDMDKSE